MRNRKGVPGPGRSYYQYANGYLFPLHGRMEEKAAMALELAEEVTEYPPKMYWAWDRSFGGWVAYAAN